MRIALIGLLLLALCGSAMAWRLDKNPDGGTWWHPVGNNQSYLYADSFTMVADPENVPSMLGTWLAAIDYYGGDRHADVTFEIWGEKDGLPDWDSVLASTAIFSTEAPGLTYYELPVVGPSSPLEAGKTYFFVINGWDKGSPSYDSYQTGAHTQGENPGYFFFSNSPPVWDGQYFTPEMAFTLETRMIPEPGLIAPLAGLLVGGLAVLRRK